jgi:CrcB protein
MAERPSTIAVIAVGGMLGASARYGVSRLIPTAGTAFPWATLLTNLTGAFALGVLLVVAVELLAPSRYLRPFAATGVLGGYTTFSTFSVEADLLAKNGRAGLALAYVAVSIAGGLAAAWTGVAVGRVAAR